MSVDVGVSQKSDPNVVPLCDILLVLLIIFMVITPAVQKGIDINLPDQNSGDPTTNPTTQGFVLTLERDLTVKLNNAPVPIEMLETKLREQFNTRQNKTIFIRADKTVPYKEVLRVLDMAKGAGIDVLGVMTQSYETGQ